MVADEEIGLKMKVEEYGLKKKARPALLKVPPMKDVRIPGLALAAHRINPDATLSDCELEEALESIDRDDDGPSKPQYWLDAEIDNLAENLAELRTKILDKLPLSNFIKRHLTSEQMQKTQVLSLQKTCVFVFRILAADDDSTKMRYATVVCIKGLLLTIHIVSPKLLDHSSHGVRLLNQDALTNMMQRELPMGTTTCVLSAWLLFHLNHVSNEAHKLRKRIFELYEKMDDNIACVSLSEIVEVKDHVLQILAVAEEQSEGMDSLAEGDNVTSAINFENLKGFKGVLLSSASSTERMMLRMEKRVQDLRQSYDAHQQVRINHRLAVLTILSSIFLPLSFMAGIWGMNFENMPELHRDNSYFYAITGMFTLACSFLCIFWHYGWFD